MPFVSIQVIRTNRADDEQPAVAPRQQCSQESQKLQRGRSRSFRQQFFKLIDRKQRRWGLVASVRKSWTVLSPRSTQLHGGIDKVTGRLLNIVGLELLAQFRPLRPLWVILRITISDHLGQPRKQGHIIVRSFAVTERG